MKVMILPVFGKRFCNSILHNKDTVRKNELSVRSIMCSGNYSDLGLGRIKDDPVNIVEMLFSIPSQCSHQMSKKETSGLRYNVLLSFTKHIK